MCGGGGGGGSTENSYTQAQGQIAKDMYADYKSIYQPQEAKYIDQVNDLNSQAAYDKSASLARGDVATSFATQRDALGRQLDGAGVDPSSGRYADTMANFGLKEAVASAGAANKARTDQRSQYLSGLSDIVHTGRGIASNAGGIMGQAGAQKAQADAAAENAHAQEVSGGLSAAATVAMAVAV